MVVVHNIQLLLGCLVTVAHGLNIPRHSTVVSREAVDKTKYDFVIAGGGVAGLTVADRLTEDPKVNVLVIESGPFDKGEDGVLVMGAFNPTPYLWPGLLTVPQPQLNNATYMALAGRVVGGGSTINGAIFLRGSAEDFDGWSTLGNKDWRWDDMLPYYRKSENFTLPDKDFAAAANISWDASVHGNKGPVQGSYPNYYFPGSANWWNAITSTGVKPAKDPNNGASKGVFWYPTLVDAKTRTRSYARLNHYERVHCSRLNYHILAENTVATVIFDGKRAVGVKYLPSGGGEESTVRASREVILAAGALHTPQILQLSGVGPNDLLAGLGIEVVADLPGVGQNYQDQPSVAMAYNFTSNTVPNWDTLSTNATYDAEQRALFDSSKQGPYTIARGLSTNIASLLLRDLTPSYLDIVKAADTNDPTASLPQGTDPTVKAGYLAQHAVLTDQLANGAPVAGFHWGTTSGVTLSMFRPFSRGVIAINSTDPLANPVIDYRTMTDPTDFDVAAAMVLKNREIMAAPAMAALGPVELGPFGAAVQAVDDIKVAVRAAINPSNAHGCCTAAMMPRKLGGVVDDKMRVYGVKGLRVVDISYWPMPISGTPTSTMYATGEKISDVIKKEYCLDGYCDEK